MKGLMKLAVVLPFVSLLAACKLLVQVPAGGTVFVDGVPACGPTEVCEIAVTDTQFESTFTAIPRQGYLFTGWKKSKGYFCGGSSGPCFLSTGKFGDYPGLMEVLASGAVFILEPMFERQAMALLYDHELKAAFVIDRSGELIPYPEMAGETILGTGSPSPDSQQVAVTYRSTEGNTYRLGVLDPDSHDLIRSREYTEYPFASWQPNSRALMVTVFQDNPRELRFFLDDEAGSQLILEHPAGNYETKIEKSYSHTGRFVAIGLTNFDHCCLEYADGASLFLFDSKKRTTSLVTESVSAIDFEFSPYVNLLYYQHFRWAQSSDCCYLATFPMGDGLIKDLRSGETTLLREFSSQTEDYLSFNGWLSKGKALFFNHGAFTVFHLGGFELRYNNGEIIVADDSLGPARVAPGNRHLAYIDRQRRVRLIDVQSGSAATLGLAEYENDGQYILEISELKWSPDGRYLAWNRFQASPSPGLSDPHQLFLHDVATGITLQLTDDLRRSKRWFFSAFSFDEDLGGLVFTTGYENDLQAMLWRPGQAAGDVKILPDVYLPLNCPSYVPQYRYTVAPDVLLVNSCDGLLKVVFVDNEVREELILAQRVEDSIDFRDGRGLLLKTESLGEPRTTSLWLLEFDGADFIHRRLVFGPRDDGFTLKAL